VKIKQFGAAALALCWVGAVAAQTATSAQWQRKAEAAVAAIRGLPGSGLKEAVRVQRDRWVLRTSMPETATIFSCAGLVVAQDRLFQMELWKRSDGATRRGTRPEAVSTRPECAPAALSRDMEAEFRSYARMRKRSWRRSRRNQRLHRGD